VINTKTGAFELPAHRIAHVTMTNDATALPSQVARFIGQCIPSVPHLEALLLMWEFAPKHWTAEELAARIYVDAAASRQILRDLERCKMIACDGCEPQRWKYDPHNELAGSLCLVAQTYRRELSRVTRFIHSQGSKVDRSFMPFGSSCTDSCRHRRQE
jgi:hypothetical protein